MKTIYSEAKHQLSNCMLHSDSEDTSPTLGRSTRYTTRRNSNHYHYVAASPAAAAASSSSTLTPNAIAAATTTATSAYDTLQRPFRYDKQRGRWSTAADFYFACTTHAFGSNVFSEMPVYALLFGGVYMLPAYLFAILLYAAPIFLIQTFLGQFSTSGSISAFRVAPLFKGIGYSILLLNLCTLTYYSVIAAVPLIYAANSLHTVIPWMSCDNGWNTANCSTHDSYNEDELYIDPHATVEFFRAIIRSTENGSSAFSFSWPIFCGVIGVWLVTLGILLKRAAFIGKFLRCTCLIMFCLFLAIFVHLLLYAEAEWQFTWETFIDFFKPKFSNISEFTLHSARAVIFMSTWVLGPGWGSVLTLGSYNSFRSDSENLTYWVSFTHVLLVIMAMLCGHTALDHFEDHVGFLHFHFEENHQMQFLYLCYAYLFGSLNSLPNFWSFLFFGMIFLAELCALIVQMMSVLTALFDEFEQLRALKTRITVGIVVTLMTTSVYFCTQQGFDHLDVLPTIAVVTHVIISLMLLLMATWIYGRERFQCDLQFMLGKTISNVKIFLIRFITPIFLLINFLQILFLLERDESPQALVWISQTSVYIVALAYMVHKVCQTTGTLRNRLKQCFAPLDWHPVDADNRRFYEEVMGTSEMLVIDNANYA